MKKYSNAVFLLIKRLYLLVPCDDEQSCDLEYNDACMLDKFIL